MRHTYFDIFYDYRGLSSEDPQRKGWLKRMLPVHSIDPGTQSHSQMLSDKDTVYELQCKTNQHDANFVNILVEGFCDKVYGAGGREAEQMADHHKSTVRIIF